MTIKHPLAFLIALAAVCSAVSAVGCSKSDQADAKAMVMDGAHDTKVAVQTAATATKDAVVDAWADVKDFTFAKRSDFTAKAKALSSQMQAKLSELRANASEAQASASRSAAMDSLKDSEADFSEKLSDLGTATADTWDEARQNTILAWDRLQAAYLEARAD